MCCVISAVVSFAVILRWRPGCRGPVVLPISPSWGGVACMAKRGTPLPDAVAHGRVAAEAPAGQIEFGEAPRDPGNVATVVARIGVAQMSVEARWNCCSVNRRNV